MKTCTKCKESKELICFYKDKSKPDGFYTWCKSCAKENAYKYRSSMDKEKISAYHRKHYQQNKAKICDYARKYRQANYDKNTERARNRKKYQSKKQEEAANLFFQMAYFASEITKQQ